MYYAKRHNGLGALGQSTCEEMSSMAETFQRLSQKKDKKAATRASAAQQADDWRRRAAACIAARSAPAPLAPLQPIVPVTPVTTSSMTVYDSAGNAYSIPAGSAIPAGYSTMQPLAPISSGYSAPLQPTYPGGFMPYSAPASGGGFQPYAAAPGGPFQPFEDTAYSQPASGGVPYAVSPGASFPPSPGGGFELIPQDVQPMVPAFPQPVIPGGAATAQSSPCTQELQQPPTSDEWGPIDVVQIVCAMQTPGAIQAGPFAVSSSQSVELEELMASGGMGRFLG